MRWRGWGVESVGYEQTERDVSIQVRDTVL